MFKFVEDMFGENIALRERWKTSTDSKLYCNVIIRFEGGDWENKL